MSIPEPEMKRDLAISHVHKEGKSIAFYATPEIAETYRKYGSLTAPGENPFDRSGTYYLIVDGRYDFEDVVAYMKDQAQQGE